MGGAAVIFSGQGGEVLKVLRGGAGQGTLFHGGLGGEVQGVTHP